MACTFVRPLARQDQSGFNPERYRLAHRYASDLAWRCGDPDVTEKLLNGHTVGDKTFKVHIDGYNQVPYLTGEVKESPRNSLIYFSDDGAVIAVRVGDYKFNLEVQYAHTMQLWAEPFVKLRVPHITNLRRDPFERADFNSNVYWDWMVNHVPQMYLMQEVVASEIEGFVEYPPRQKPASFNLDAVLATAQAATGAAAKAKGAGK